MPHIEIAPEKQQSAARNGTSDVIPHRPQVEGIIAFESQVFAGLLDGQMRLRISRHRRRRADWLRIATAERRHNVIIESFR